MSVKQVGRAPASPNETVRLADLVWPMGQCRLAYASATSLILKPYQGNQLWVNGAFRTIPAGGVSLANTGLTAGTLYYVHAYMAGSSLVLEPSTTGHAVDTTYGHDIKAGDPSRSIVGMTYMDAGSPGTFADTAAKRYVASWFNRVPRTLYSSTGAPSGNVATTSTSQTELSTALRSNFICWADEIVDVLCSGYAAENTAAGFTALRVGIDATAPGSLSAQTSSSGGQPSALASRATVFLSEGMHFATPLAYVSGGGSQVYVDIQGRIG